jgi:hypothetical protein
VDAPSLRASDADRDAAADRLRAAAGEGRLDPDELDERVGEVYAARTVGELARLTEDLPQPALGSQRVSPLKSEAARQRLAGFLIPNLICNAIWLATGAGYWWPVWVLLGTGIGLAVWLVHALLGIEENDSRRQHELPRP